MAKKKSKPTKRKKTSAANKPQTVDIESLQKPSVLSAPVWVDRMQLTGRTDGVVIMAFETAITEHGLRLEVCRLAMTPSLANSISEVIARQVKFVKEDEKKGRDM